MRRLIRLVDRLADTIADVSENGWDAAGETGVYSETGEGK
jgi:hypothetical protein